MKTYKLHIMLPLLLGVCSIHGQVALRNQGVMSVGGTTTALYVLGDMQAADASAIHQRGKTLLAGDLVNDAASGNVFAGTYTTGTFEFGGSSPQRIYGSASKAANYILFPQTVSINNQATDVANATVTLDAAMGATVADMGFTRGRFVLDSKTVTVSANSMHAHLMVTGNIAYATDKSHIQVNLSLGDNYSNKRLAGFTPPFRKLYADYFFYNFLSRPTDKGLFGNSGRLIIDPRSSLKAGLGYIVGMGIIPTGDSYYTTQWDPRWSSALQTDKVTDMFRFARQFGAASFTQYITSTNAPDRFSGEQLVTEDVSVPLEQGFNYLGNPFTVPLDMTDFVEGTGTGNWGITRGSGGAGELRNGFYVMSQGTGSYAGGVFTFNASYLLAQEQGGTLDRIGGKYLLAPMQLFVVGKNTAGAGYMTIPANKRTHGAVNYLRSATYETTDEILLESRDTQSGGFDRLCVVFRSGASEAAGDIYDAPKLFNRSGGVNQIYTRSSDNKDMTTNVIPPTTRRLPLYFEPSLEAQEVEIEASRLESLQSVYDVQIEDTRTGKKSSFMREPVYRFTSTPGDSPARFVLHFTSNPTGTEEITSTELATWYENGITNIKGLEGENLWLYNAQGLLIIKEKVTAPSMQIKRRLDTGVYFIRTEGKTIKLYVR